MKIWIVFDIVVIELFLYYPDKEVLRNYTQYAFSIRHERETKTFELVYSFWCC